MRHSTSITSSVCWSVGWLVGWLVGWSVRHARVENARNAHFTMLQLSLNVCGCKCVGRGLGWGWGLAAPAHPSATILWPPRHLFRFQKRPGRWLEKIRYIGWRVDKHKYQNIRSLPSFLTFILPFSINFLGRFAPRHSSVYSFFAISDYHLYPYSFPSIHLAQSPEPQSIKSHPDGKKTPNATLSHSTHLYLGPISHFWQC